MYSRTVIDQIHSALQALNPSALVLLGGSYLYGEAAEESDVDFYLICPLWRLFFLQRYKKLMIDLRKRFPDVDFSLMVVPRWLKHYGYYIYGRDVNGKIHSWAVPMSVLVRNCLKLAYFNYLRAMVNPSLYPSPNRGGAGGGVRERNLNKARKQLAVAHLAAAGKIDFGKPIFSKNYILANTAKSDEQQLSFRIPVAVGEESLSGQQQLNNGTVEPFDLDRDLSSSAWADSLEMTSDLLPYFSFSWSNYLLYNVRFLLRGNPLFLFKNPDRMILHRLADGLRAEENYEKLYKEMKEIIFPVIIL